MKKGYYLLVALLCCSFFIISCEREHPQGGSMNDYDSPPAVLTIVKFANREDTSFVIVQHPIIRRRNSDGYMEYEENIGLFLNVTVEDSVGCGMTSETAAWVDTALHISRTSPYIPLIDDYYLISWKWHQLCPLSAIAEVWNQNSHNYLAEHLSKHCFWTNIKWVDFDDFFTPLSSSLYTQTVQNVEIIRVSVPALARMYHRDADPFHYFNYSIYTFDGMCWQNAYAYYANQEEYALNQTYHDYINYCDSLQVVYHDRLVELINNGKLKEVEYNAL